LGHGDAVYQACAEWNKPQFDYVLVNFAGDANSYRSALLSLLVLDTLNACNLPTPALVTVTLKANPDYPILRDQGGLLMSLKHHKLTGAHITRHGVALGESNVGLWLFKREFLCEALQELRRLYFDPVQGYRIPGNKLPELAIDNAMQFIIDKYALKVPALCVARPEQITPFKGLDQMAGFIEAVRTTLVLDHAFKKKNGLI
jgi:hypothetical protein